MFVITDLQLGPTGQINSMQGVDLSEDPTPVIEHPDTKGALMSRRDFVRWLSDNRHRHPGTGWDEKANPLIFGDRTRWQVLADAANHPSSPQHLRDLKLK